MAIFLQFRYDITILINIPLGMNQILNRIMLTADSYQEEYRKTKTFQAKDIYSVVPSEYEC